MWFGDNFYKFSHRVEYMPSLQPSLWWLCNVQKLRLKICCTFVKQGKFNFVLYVEHILKGVAVATIFCVYFTLQVCEYSTLEKILLFLFFQRQWMSCGEFFFKLSSTSFVSFKKKKTFSRVYFKFLLMQKNNHIITRVLSPAIRIFAVVMPTN